jgi:hypothetical protein
MGIELRQIWDSSYGSVKDKSAYKKASYDEAVSLLDTTVGNHLERILGKAQMQACSGSNVKIGFRVNMSVRPKPAIVYAFLRTMWSSASTRNKAELDETIAADIDPSTIETITSSLANMKLAWIKREMVCKAPLAEADQVEKVMGKLDKIGPMRKFVGDFNQKYKECDRTVEKIATELDVYLRNDRERITKALSEDAGANSQRGYAALKDGAASASQSAKRTASPSPSGLKGQGAPADDEQRIQLLITLKKTIAELKRTAPPKGFCTYCYKDGHKTDSGGGCYAMQKVVRELESEKKETKDGTGQGSGRNRGGRGRWDGS